MPLSLPSPSSLLKQLHSKHGSTLFKYSEADVQLKGGEFDPLLGAQHAKANGNDCAFAPGLAPASPTLDQIAYATYHFTLPQYDRNAQVRLHWTAPPGSSGDYFVGLANWKADHWQWYPGNANDIINLPPIDSFLTQFGDVVVVVAVLGAQEAQLSSVRIGGLPPVPVLQATKTSGVPPLSTTLSASQSSDPEGLDLTYEFDFDGDGVFDTPSQVSWNASHDYTVAGNFSPRVRVTNSLHIFAEASCTVSALGEWGHALGAKYMDNFYDLAVDAAGNTYTVGDLQYPESNVLLAKWAPGGQLIWAKQWDSGDDDYGTAICINGEGDIIVGGELDYVGKRQILILKFDPQGNYMWGKRGDMNGTYNQLADIAVDGTDIFYAGTSNFLNSSKVEVIVGMISDSGNTHWAKYRDTGASSYVENMQLLHGLVGIYGVSVLCHSDIGGATNLWRIEYSDTGAFTRGQQLGTSAQYKFGGRMLETFTPAQLEIRYYVAGSIEVGGVDQNFISCTDEDGNSVWCKRFPSMYLGLEYIGLAPTGSLVFGGYNTDNQYWQNWAVTSTLDGTATDLLQQSSTAGNMRAFACAPTQGGMVMCGEGLNNTQQVVHTAPPAATDMTLSWQSYPGSGGNADSSFYSVPATMTLDATLVCTPDTGAGNTEGTVYRFMGW